VSKSTKSGDIELTFILGAEAADAVRELAALRRVDISEALRYAIGTDLFLVREVYKGSRILVERGRWRHRTSEIFPLEMETEGMMSTCT